MSHDTNTIDSRTHEGELNKLGFWIFITAEFALFGTLFATLLTLQHGGDYAGKMTTELFARTANRHSLMLAADG